VVTKLSKEKKMEENTRERIIRVSLDMFAQNGYKGTNLRDIAKEIDLSKSAIYKHFESKEAIWNEIVEKGEEYYEKRFGSESHLPKIPETTEELKMLTMHQVEFTVNDPMISKIRKLLTIEQFRDERLSEIATKHFITGIEQMFAKLFEGMMENGLLKKDDPQMLAMEFISPVTLLVHDCDRNPYRTQLNMIKIEKHICHFIEVYKA